MKFIDDYMQKKAQASLDSIKKENEQMVRKARLSELESKHNEKKNMLLHPVRTANERKEIKNLKEEIAAYEKEKEDKNSILILVGMLIVGFILLISLGTRHNSSAPNPSDNETTVAMTSNESETENTAQTDTTVPPVVISEEPSNIATGTEDSDTSETIVSEESEITESQETVEVVEDDEEIEDTYAIKLPLSDLKIRYVFDYVHVSTDSIVLGNDEGVTFTIEVDKKDVEIEDLFFDYDTSLLNVDFEETVHQDGKTIINAYVTANEECSTELFISTNYEEEMSNEDGVLGYPITIRKLDSSEGRVVYVTPTGTKYHYSPDCAGENAMKTTLYDAESWECEPCGTCAN